MAQSVEQLIHNQQAAGSNPATSSKGQARCLSFFCSRILGFALCLQRHEPASAADAHNGLLNSIHSLLRSQARYKSVTAPKDKRNACFFTFIMQKIRGAGAPLFYIFVIGFILRQVVRMSLLLPRFLR